jgi:hypothetical protein
MTPKEKAEELHVGFWKLTNDSRIAKQCALIVVDEILIANTFNNDNIETYLIKYKYYQEVRQEIQKL